MLHDLYSPEARELIGGFARRPVGWFCSYTPVEIIEAAGFLPVRISGVRRSSGLGDSLMHTNICPFVKGCIEAADTGKLDFIDAFVFTNGCDAQRRLYDVWRHRRPNDAAHIISVPKTIGDASVSMLAAEFIELRNWLVLIGGRLPEEDSLRAVFRATADVRKKLAALMDCGSERKVAGSRMLELLLAAQRMPAEAALQMLDEAENSAAPNSHDGSKVLLYGNMMDDPAFPRIVEKYGTAVVSLDVCAGRRYIDTPEPSADAPALDSLASAYLRKSPCPRMACEPDAVSELKRRVEEIRPDGVIIYTLKFCDTHGYNGPRIRDMLRELGVRALFVEDDYSGVTGQLETRIQAFVEMLGE